MSRRRFTDDEEYRVCEEYREGASGPEIAAKHGTYHGLIYSILHRREVLRHTNRQAFGRYTLDETVFEHATPQACYWAGFLLADGNITRMGKSWALRLRLSIKDKAHLLSFRQFLHSTHPIVSRQNRGYPGSGIEVGLLIGSRALIDALARYGVTGNKQVREALPGWLENNRDTWRGLVDGDGWVCKSAYPWRDGWRPVIGLTGSAVLCEQFRQYAGRLSIPCPRVYRNHTIFKFVLAGTPATVVIRALYENASPALSRKKILADSLLAGWKPANLRRTAL